MNDEFSPVIEKLESLKEAIISSTTDDRTMLEMWSVPNPPLNRHDLANMVDLLINKFNSVKKQELDQETIELLNQIPPKVDIFKRKLLPHLFNGGGHGHNVYTSFSSLLFWIDSIINPFLQWEILNDKDLLPKELTKRLASINAQLNLLAPNKELLEEKLKLINETHSAAEGLPTDLETLKNVQKQISEYQTTAGISASGVEESFNTAKKISEELKKHEQEALRIVNLSDEAYRIATTQGLAAAFELRASNLTKSTWLWVFILLGGLTAGVLFGKSSFETLGTVLKEKDVSSSVLWIRLLTSILSLGGPVWLAWIATKQIGHRFRLSEDYAFKASVAKAYEGYRKEAARLDPEFEMRLFGSALTRLDEAPLRLVDDKNYGSPWQEFLASPQIQEVIRKFPELASKIPTSIRFSKDKITLETKEEEAQEEQNPAP